MIYLTSDTHGYPLKRLIKLLHNAGFSDSDTLYILGDAIDRGKEGIEVIQWIMKTPNVKLLMGNHEYMMSQCADYFINDGLRPSQISEKLAENLEQWSWNGSRPTIRALRKLDPETVKEIFAFISQLPLYETITANGNDFILVHAGLGNFRPERQLSDYTVHELVWTRPNKETRYYEDKTVILGHTPTGYRFGEKGKMFRTDTWIDIDTGAASGGAPMLLRLDDMQEFYA